MTVQNNKKQNSQPSWSTQFKPELCLTETHHAYLMPIIWNNLIIIDLKHVHALQTSHRYQNIVHDVCYPGKRMAFVAERWKSFHHAMVWYTCGRVINVHDGAYEILMYAMCNIHSSHIVGIQIAVFACSCTKGNPWDETAEEWQMMGWNSRQGKPNCRLTHTARSKKYC